MKNGDLLSPYQTKVTQAMRSVIKGHAPAILWFTGLSGSGKSVIANLVDVALNKDFQAHTYLLDGDNFRRGLNADLGFSLADRTENIRRAGEVAKLMADSGLIVLAAFISPLRADRDKNRALLQNQNYIEILVDCPLSVCEARDTKGLYARARAGEIKDFTGISSPYEPPLQAEITLDSAVHSAEECARIVIDYLQTKGIIQHG
jgi:adenylyl-sulfate kinase